MNAKKDDYLLKDGRIKKIRTPLVEEEMLVLRHPKTERHHFRHSLETMGTYMGYEIAKHLPVSSLAVKTQLNSDAYHHPLKSYPVIVDLLRAGTPFVNGLQRAFTQSEAGFIGTMRDEKTLQSTISYLALPELKGKTVILADTMIATGGSIIDEYERIRDYQPLLVIVAGVIASSQAIEKLAKTDIDTIFISAIDEELNKSGYIVPGLGDAGDRCYGKKI